jgi:hypothetical protein
MKKILAAALSLFIAFSLSACGSNYEKTLKNAKDYPSLCKAAETAEGKNGKIKSFDLKGTVSLTVSNTTVNVPFDVSAAYKDGKYDMLATGTLTDKKITVYLDDSNLLYIGYPEDKETQWIKLDIASMKETLENAQSEAGAGKASESSNVIKGATDSSIKKYDDMIKKIKAFMQEKEGNDNGISFYNTFIYKGFHLFRVRFYHISVLFRVTEIFNECVVE